MTKVKAICHDCEHDEHEPGDCTFLFVYARGPNDAPGNQGCLCGYTVESTLTKSNDDQGWLWVNSPTTTHKLHIRSKLGG